MATNDERHERDLDAGDFSTWLDQVLGAIAGENDAQVPCGTCTACCTSSQFVHIGPDETETLARIPAVLRFPAPRLPRGHVLLGYDEHGCCPMLVDGACSIYEHRPRTCRTYDCRVFPASGIEVDEPDKALIAARVRRWRFDHDTDGERRHDAVRAAAVYLTDHAGELPDDLAPTTATHHAVLAVEAHDAFLPPDRTDGTDATDGTQRPAPPVGRGPALDDVLVAITRRRPPRP